MKLGTLFSNNKWLFRLWLGVWSTPDAWSALMWQNYGSNIPIINSKFNEKGNLKNLKRDINPRYSTPCFGLELAQGKNFKQMNVFLKFFLSLVFSFLDASAFIQILISTPIPIAYKGPHYHHQNHFSSHLNTPSKMPFTSDIDRRQCDQSNLQGYFVEVSALYRETVC